MELTISSDNGNTDERYPACERCHQPAVVKGPIEDGGQLHTGIPLCGDCYRSPSDLNIQAEDIDHVVGEDMELFTTPADTVFVSGTDIIIRHGPGDQTTLSTT